MHKFMWTPWYTTAFVIGIIEIVICACTFIFPSRKITLILRISFDVLSIVNGVCILNSSGSNALIAAIAVDSIGLVRDGIFYMREKYKWANSVLWLIFFEIVFFCSLIFTWAGPISLLITFAGAIVAVGLYLKDQKLCKIINIVGEILFITYFALLINTTDLLTILNLIMSSAFFVSCIIGLIVIFVKERKQNRNNVK